MLDWFAFFFFSRAGYTPEKHYGLRSVVDPWVAEALLIDRPYWFFVFANRLREARDMARYYLGVL